MIIILLILSVESQPVKIDYSNDWKEKSLNNQYVDSLEIISEIEDYDFSEIWTEFQHARYGFIGKNYQRIQIHFISIIKNQDNPLEYLVYGKSKVGNNICEFSGTMSPLHARYYKEFDVDTLKQGFLLSKCELFENPKQSYSGEFKGILKSNWYITTKGNIKYDDLQLAADSYSNNGFVGTWKNYKSKEEKTCNWGEFRIPFSGDLDIGVAEFHPNKKYLQYGWSDSLPNPFDSKEIEEWWK
jgi:hypothetical protein